MESTKVIQWVVVSKEWTFYCHPVIQNPMVCHQTECNGPLFPETDRVGRGVHLKKIFFIRSPSTFSLDSEARFDEFPKSSEQGILEPMDSCNNCMQKRWCKITLKQPYMNNQRTTRLLWAKYQLRVINIKDTWTVEFEIIEVRFIFSGNVYGNIGRKIPPCVETEKFAG